MRDEHYTSAELADLMVDSLPQQFRPQMLGDFAAGEGSLILPAIKRWPRCRVVCNDVSNSSARWLRNRLPRALVSNVDFLNERSVKAANFAPLKGKLDLILLNPPFSQRLVGPTTVVVEGKTYRVGIAMAFLVRALQYLSEGGRLVAVMPEGSLVSDRDAIALNWIKSNYQFHVFRRNHVADFSGVRARTCLIRIGPRKRKKPLNLESDGLVGCLDLLHRGRCQMHKVKKHLDSKGRTLIHTKQLVDGRVSPGPRVEGFPVVEGPALLFPRVGRVTPEKVAILDAQSSGILSDCVIAFRCASVAQAADYRQKVLKNWNLFASAYKGTGAPYVTVYGLSQRLSAILGVQSARS